MLKNWLITTTSTICDIYTGNSINENEKSEKYTGLAEGLNYIGTKDIGFDQTINYENGVKIPEGLSDFKIAPIGTTLLCIEGGSAGRKIGLTRQNVCFGNKLCAFVPKINQKFVFYFLQTENFRKIFSLNKNGLIGGVSVNKLKEIEIPLPPLAEQGRIVQKIEELFADIDAGIQNLKSVQNQIKLYRQSVLKAAFDSINKWKFVKDITDLIKIGPFGTMLHEADYVSNGIPLINPSHIKNLNIHPSSDKCVSLEKAEELSGFKLKQNDIILGRRGEMGRCAVVKQNEENWLCGTGSMFLRLKEDFFPPFYCLFLSSPRNISYLEKNAAGTTMKNLNEKIVANIPVPVPTLDEQERIVAEIERRFERADELEKAVNDALADAEKMKQAVLKKAFRGELVAQNPDDEPAAVLLDRIRAERASAPKSPKKGKRK